MGETASSIQIQFVHDSSIDSIKELEIKAFNRNEELPSTSTHCTSVSINTKDDDQNQVVNEDLNDENDNMPLGMIIVSSQNAERIIITIKKSNRKQQKIERTLLPGQNIIDIDDGEKASSVQICLRPPTKFEMILCFNNQLISKIGPKCCLVSIFIFASIAVVIVFMVIHRLDVFNMYCLTDILVIVVFLFSNIVGCIGFGVLMHKNYNSSFVKNRSNVFTFLKFKLILMFIFGLGYLLHSGLYVWKHTFPEDCSDNSIPDIIYNLSSIIYVVFVLFYFALFYDSTHEHIVTKHCSALTLITVASLCIWLNAILFESNFLYEKNTDNVNSTTKNSTKSNIAVEAIEKLDTFCAPAMVEFSLMVIDMLFSNTTEDSPKKKLQLAVNGKKSSIIVEIIVQIISSLMMFAFFAFVLVVVLTTNSDENLFDHPAYFKTYVVFELILKAFIFILLIICIYTEREYVLICRCLKRSSVVLIATAFVNSIYHLIYVFALCFGNLHDMSKNVPLVNNIASICVAACQTLFITGIHSNMYRQQSTQTKRTVYNVCFILGVFNLGLWISDSIAEDRISVFSFFYYWAHKCTISSSIYTAIFPITIFFRFQAGLEFLEFFWEHETVPDERIRSNV